MMNMKVKLYDGIKYEAESKKIAEIEYKVNSYKVVNGEQLKEEFGNYDGSMADEYDEYLVLYLATGGEATFRNSYCDLFRA